MLVNPMSVFHSLWWAVVAVPAGIVASALSKSRELEDREANDLVGS